MSGHYRKGLPYHPNAYAKIKLHDLKKILGGCQWPGCTTTAPSALDFAHLKDTPILEDTVRGRGRKERLQDVMRYPDSYTLFCDGGAGGHHDAFDRAQERGELLSWQPKSLLQLAEEVGVLVFPRLQPHQAGDPR